MHTHMTFAMAALLSWSSLAAAQSGSTAPTQPTKDSKAPTVTVTGCVAQGTNSTSFVLNNATTADATTKGATATPDKTKMGADANAKMSYLLTGGENLKAHVGHRVTVTGTLDKIGMGMKPGEKTEASVPSASGPALDIHGGTLKVQALKMVSTTCP
jgi:hypothetical protein